MFKRFILKVVTNLDISEVKVDDIPYYVVSRYLDGSPKHIISEFYHKDQKVEEIGKLIKELHKVKSPWFPSILTLLVLRNRICKLFDPSYFWCAVFTRFKSFFLEIFSKSIFVVRLEEGAVMNVRLLLKLNKKGRLGR